MPNFSEMLDFVLPILFLGLMLVFGWYWGRETRKILIKCAIDGETERIKKLLQSQLQRAYMDSKDNEGMSPLMYAAREGHFEIVEYLVQRGADTNAQNNAGWTALALAESKGHADVVRLLREIESYRKRQTPPVEMTRESRSPRGKRRWILATLLSVPVATAMSVMLYAIGWRGVLHSFFAAIVTVVCAAYIVEKGRWREFREAERPYHPTRRILISNALFVFEESVQASAIAFPIVWAAMAGIAFALSAIWPEALDAILGF
jgi:hypothetical protein